MEYNYFMVLPMSGGHSYWLSGLFALGGATIGFLGANASVLLRRRYEMRDVMHMRLEKLYSLSNKLVRYLDTCLDLSCNGINCFKSVKEGIVNIKKIPNYQDLIEESATELQMLLNLYFEKKFNNPFGNNNKLLNQVFYALETICSVEHIKGDTNSPKIISFLQEREGYFMELRRSLIKFKHAVAKAV